MLESDHTIAVVQGRSRISQHRQLRRPIASPMENTVAVRNVLLLHLAERPKQLPGSGTVAALAIYVRHDLLLPLNMTATETNVSLGFSKVLQLNRAGGRHVVRCG